MGLEAAEANDIDDDSPAEADDAEQADDSQDDDESAPEESAPEEAAPEDAAPAATEDDRPRHRAEKVPDNNTVNVIGQKPNLDNEDALFAADLKRGHVKHETIQSLFENQNTLGKIGTLFGMLVGGVGSGLTGQPNAAMKLMQDQLDKDFEDQQTSNANAQNWLRLSHEHQMQKAQISELGARTANEQEDTYGRAITNAQNWMRMSAQAEAQHITDKLPPGPTKDNAQNIIDTQIGPAVDAENKAANARQMAKEKLREALINRGKPQQQSASPRVDTTKIQSLLARGQQRGTLGLLPDKDFHKNGMSEAEASRALTESGVVNNNRGLQDAYIDTVKKLDASPLAARGNPEYYNALVEPFIGQMIRAVGSGEAGTAVANSMLPGPKDFGQARQEKLTKGFEHFAIMENNTPVLDSWGLKPPPPKMPELTKSLLSETGTALGAPSEKKAPSGPKEGDKTKSKSGKPMIYKHGSWNYVK